MARPLRIEFPGAHYHVTSRGNAGRPVFQSNDDRFRFLDIFKEVVNRFKWICHAYCLMDNHYHLLIETVDGRLSHGMRQLNGVYTQRFNRCHQHNGSVFQGRYKAILFERDRYLLELSRYLVLHPVRAKVVARPEQYRWSSYRATAGFLKGSSALTTDWILKQFADNQTVAQKLYRRFIAAGTEKPAPWFKLKAQCLLGSRDFIEKIAPALTNPDRLKELCKTQHHLNRPVLAKVLVAPVESNKTKRNKSIAAAHLKYGYSLSEIANHLGLHYSTISKIAKNQPL